MHSATHQAIDTAWRLECAKIVAAVARLVRDVGLAEEMAQDALVAALEHWPATTSMHGRRSSCLTSSTPSMRRGPTRSATTCCG
jgi:predicted RNA polymerase sigma factor